MTLSLKRNASKLPRKLTSINAVSESSVKNVLWPAII
jgi:hypothetical protein